MSAGIPMASATATSTHVAGPAMNASRPFSNTTGRYLNKNSNRASNAHSDEDALCRMAAGRRSADLLAVPAFTRMREAPLAGLQQRRSTFFL
jgi:hypothetical protein